jgi:hypothetical protein
MRLRVIPLVALAAGVAILARAHAESRPLVAPAAAAIYGRLLPAISRMIAAREISDTRALAIARGYVHDNAAALYR